MFTYHNSIFQYSDGTQFQSDEWQTNGWDLELALVLTGTPWIWWESGE